MNITNVKEEVNIQKMYGNECKLSKQDFISKYKISEKGLSSNEANSKLNKYGLNEIKQNKPKRWY